jgi:hypothetical protein
LPIGVRQRERTFGDQDGLEEKRGGNEKADECIVGLVI